MDRINISYNADSTFNDYINLFADYIKKETLAIDISTGNGEGKNVQDWEIGDFNCKIAIEKAGN